jgi:membrane dipeptidase
MRVKRPLALFAISAALVGCAAEEPPTASEDLWSQAQRLARESIIVDTHVDTPSRVLGEEEDLSVLVEKGNFDHPRAVEGGLNAPFMAIFVPASLQEEGGAKERAEELITMVRGWEERWPDKFAVATSVADVREQFTRGVVSLPMGMENGAPVGNDLANVAYFHDQGIRYIGLSHSEPNQICDSSYAEERPWGGLSPFGRRVVEEMNRVGMMVDVSHVSDEAFWDVIEVSRAPVIASHSSARRFTPGFERNIDDEMIRAVGENGGVVQINFGSSFLREDSNERGMESWDAVRAYMEENELEMGSPEFMEWLAAYRAENPTIFADISDVVAHIDHVVDLVGIDHVGLGSDFDGVGDTLPTGLKDVSDFPNLAYELLKRGYSEEDIRKVFGENLLRVWSEVERVAAETQAGAQ